MACCSVNLDVDVVRCVSALWPMLRLSRPKSGIKKLEKEMGRLRSKRDDIKNHIDAEGEGKIPTNEVIHWLGEVETLEGQVAAIEQDFQSMSCFSCYYCCSINRRTAEKLGVAHELMRLAGALDPIVIDLSMPKSSIKELEKEMARLRCKRDDIKNQIDEAEREGKIPTNEVSRWLREVEMLEGQVIDIEQDFLRAAEKLSEAKELMNRAGALDSIARVGPQEPTVTLPISHRPPVGIELHVKDIVDYIDGGESKIIGIYGMGGVGKTTILSSIQRHYLKHNKFDLVIWVVASKDCQLKRLQMDIAKSLDLKTLLESDDERTCGDKLFSYLENRNCLLLLDDIWEHVNLQRLGMAHPATEKGQQEQKLKVVVLTIRKETVCGDMEAEKKIKVNCLDLDQAWQLFEQNCEGDVLSSDAGIMSRARELAKECAGLPLALVTVARAMRRKKSWEAWNDALHQIRDKHDWTINGLSEDSLVMYNAFKLSYDSLENDSIRECLLCCALWPEDFEINKLYELIPCWIGCGIIHEFNIINEAFAKGYSYLDALMAASLLEHSSALEYFVREKRVKMHDVIRDMALFMVSGLKGNGRKWIVKAGIGLNHLPRQEEWQEAERASFMRNKITSLQDYGASIFPKLSMLILRGNRNLKTISQNLLPSMPCLTYLDLSYCGITELPMEISSLTELQYLNVSNNRIRRLPAEFGCLGKLEYLLLTETNIESGPNGMISNLSMLKLLDIKGIHLMSEWWWDELKCFKGHHQLSVAIDIYPTTANIERLNMLPNVSIWDLNICVVKTSEYSDRTIDGDDTSELPVLAVDGNNASELSVLALDGDDTLELPNLPIDGDDTSELLNLNLGTPQWSYNISDNLEFLFVQANILMLTSGVGYESSFRSLKRLTLFDLQLLEEISLNGGLYNLREINIYQCPMLKDVSWILQLPCLGLLQIIGCPKMKELISDVGNTNSISSIKSLNLWDLSNLTCIENQPFHFPYLEYIYVALCPEFKNLSLGAEISKSKLKEIRGNKAWWHNLEWDHESHKNFLTPRFIPTR